MKIQEKVYFLDRANIDTDQIIPAKYLTGISISGLGPHLFEDLDMPGFSQSNQDFQEATILIAQENFGCGSSREHAVWALEANDFKVVIAPSFARIFRQNMFNRGLLAIEISQSEIDQMFNAAGRMVNCEVDLNEKQIKCNNGLIFRFSLDEFAERLVREDGLVGFVAKNY